jgi:hypothetical protein
VISERLSQQNRSRPAPAPYTLPGGGSTDTAGNSPPYTLPWYGSLARPTAAATLNAETFSRARFIGSRALSSREIADATAHAGIAAGLGVAEAAAVSDRGHKSCTDNNVSSRHYLRLAQRHGIAPSIKVPAASPKF